MDFLMMKVSAIEQAIQKKLVTMNGGNGRKNWKMHIVTRVADATG
jgi:hypothetical protein